MLCFGVDDVSKEVAKEGLSVGDRVECRLAVEHERPARRDGAYAGGGGVERAPSSRMGDGGFGTVSER